MNFGSILGTASPAFGIASGQGAGALLGNLSPALMLAKALKGGHGGGHGEIPPVDPAGAVPPPTVQSNAAPPPQQPLPAQHGLGVDGKFGAGNMQGILGGLSMMAPGAASNPNAMAQLAPAFGNLRGVRF